MRSPDCKKRSEHERTPKIAGMTVLPSEMHDQIIDHLHDDRPSLIACGLTCRAWLPSVRCHIFSTVVLTPLKKFVPTLRELHATIAHIVTRLVVQLKSMESWKFKDAEVLDLAFILSCLPSITSLRLHGILPSEDNLHFIFTHLSDVTDLELVEMAFETMKECTELVYAFPKLRTLSMVDFCCLKSIGPESLQLFQQGPAFRVRAISLGLQSGSGEVLDWLFARDPPPTVDTLLCYTDVADAGVRAQRLMAAIGQHVTTLDITLINDARRHVDFTNCPKVRSVIIREVELTPQHTPEQRAWVPMYLLSSKIEEISLFIQPLRTVYSPNPRLVVDLSRCLDSLDWEELERRLSGSQLPKFRILAIHWGRHSPDIAEAERIIREDKLAAPDRPDKPRFYEFRQSAYDRDGILF